VAAVTRRLGALTRWLILAAALAALLVGFLWVMTGSMGLQ